MPSRLSPICLNGMAFTLLSSSVAEACRPAKLPPGVVGNTKSVPSIVTGTGCAFGTKSNATSCCPVIRLALSNEAHRRDDGVLCRVVGKLHIGDMPHDEAMHGDLGSWAEPPHRARKIGDRWD